MYLIGNLIVLFLNNFIYIPLIFYNIIKKKKYVFMLALFLAVLAFFFQPEDGFDLMKYYELYKEPSNIRDSFFAYQRDYFAKYMMEMLIYFRLPKELLAFSSAFISYYFLFKSLSIILANKNYSAQKRIVLNILLYLAIPIIDYTGIRALPSIALMAYSIVLKYIKRTKKYLIFGVFSVLTHSFMGIIFFFLIFSEKIYKKKLLKIILFFSLILGKILDQKLILEITNIINSLDIVYISPNYIIGKWGSGYGEELNFMGKLFRIYILPNLRLIIAIFYSFFILQSKDKIASFITALMSIYFLFINYHTISTRYFKLILICIIFYFVNNKNKSKSNKYKILLCLLVLYCLLIFLLDFKSFLPYFIESYKKYYEISLFNVLYTIFNY